MKTLYLLAIGVIIVSTFNSCKRKCHDKTNPDCDNYDPCYGVTEANADFYIYELLGEPKTKDTMLTEADTIYGHNKIYCVPKFDNDSFIWEIGAETIRSKTFFREDFPSDQYISVKLIVKKNSNCLSKNRQSDTVIKRFYVKSLYKTENDTNSAFKNAFWGTWKGKHISSKEDEFMVSFGYVTNHKININQAKPYVVAGLPKGLWPQLPFYQDQENLCCCGENYKGYKSFFRIRPLIDGIQSNFALQYRARIDNNFKIRINYNYNETSYTDWLNGAQFPNGTPYKKVEKVWEGYKISNKILR